MTIRYDENGIPEAKIQAGEYRSGQIRELRSVLNEFSRRIQERYEYSDRESSDVYMKTPKNRTFTFAMTESNLKAYMDNWYYTGYTVPERTSGTILILLCVVAAAALLLPVFSTLHTGMRESSGVLWKSLWRQHSLAISCSLIISGICFPEIREGWRVLDVLVWAGVFAGTYWAAANVRHLPYNGAERISKRIFPDRAFLRQDFKRRKMGDREMQGGSG